VVLMSVLEVPQEFLAPNIILEHKFLAWEVYYFMKFYILMAVATKTVFRSVTSCSLVVHG
jgi:hypothetical protein